MALRPPRQLSTFLKGMQIRRDVPGLEEPRLWGEGEKEYGVDYPVGYQPPTEEETQQALAGISERQKQGEQERQLVREMKAKAAQPKNENQVMAEFYKHHPDADPAQFDAVAEASKVVEEEERDIKEKFDVPPDGEVSPRNKNIYKAYKELLKEAKIKATNDAYNRLAALKEEDEKRREIFRSAETRRREKQEKIATEKRAEEAKIRTERRAEVTKIREEERKAPTKGGAAAIQIYDRFKAENPDYKGDIKEFQKSLKAKDPMEMVLSLAGKDFRVQIGSMSLGDVAQQYLDAILKLKGAGAEKIVLPPTIKRTSQALRWLMSKHGMTKQEAIDWLKANR